VALDGAPAIIAGIVATVCAVLAFASWRALVRTGNRGIYYVVAAFALLALKNLVKAFTLGTTGETETTELVFSLADLGAVVLFAWPLLRNVGVAW
jgi:Fe2+ transport system protein B